MSVGDIFVQVFDRVFLKQRNKNMSKIYIIVFKCCRVTAFGNDANFLFLVQVFLIVDVFRAKEIKVMYCVFSCHVKADWQLQPRHLSHFAFRKSQWNVVVSVRMYLLFECGMVKISIIFK